MSNFDIAGKLIVVTGGAGQLGQQWVPALETAGARCVVIDLVDGGDVTSPGYMRHALAAETVPDAVICAAAIDAKPGTPGCGRPEDVPLEDFERTIRVNLVGVQNTIQTWAKAMMLRGSGGFILVSSIFGMVAPDHRRYTIGDSDNPQSFWKPAAYSASKAGLLGLARYWGTYLAPYGVRCNAVTFGSMNRDDYSSSFRTAFERDVPMGRFAQPGEFNGVLQWLISDASSYVTGANIVVDGGFTAW